MSPSEFDLRAALRQGESDELDANAVVGRARQARRHRRRTIGAIAGSVAAVAAIATAGSLVLNDVTAGSNPSSSARAAANPDAVASPPRASRPAAQPEPETGSGCPVAAPAVIVPSTAHAGQAPLFPTPVDRMLVCVFPSPRPAAAASAEVATSYLLTGPEARTIADRFNALAASTAQPSCPPAPTVVLITTDVAGETSQAVASAGCTGVIATATAWRGQARDVLLTLINKGLPQPFTAPHASIGPGPS